MYGGKKNNSRQTSIVVIPGRTDEPDMAQVGQVKVKDPLSHGNDVSIDDLPFVTCGHPPLLSSFVGRPPPRGTGGEVDSDGPPGQRKLKFIYTDLNNGSTSMSGNKNLFNMNTDIFGAWQKKENYWPLPNIQETQERGAIVRKVQEKGQRFSTNMLAGLPINSSLFPMLEQRLPSKKDIETAKEHFGNILGGGVLAGLPGKVMGMGDMLKGLSGSQKSSVRNSVPSDVYNAFESLSELMPSYSGGGGISDMRVNEQVFTKNALELIRECQTVSDLCEVMARLSWDESLYGLDSLEETVVVVDGPFGSVQHRVKGDGTILIGDRQQVDGLVSNVGNVTITGNVIFSQFSIGGVIEFSGNNHSYTISNVGNTWLKVTDNLPELSNDMIYIVNTSTASVRASESGFASFMGSSGASGGAPSINPGENLFGDSSSVLFDMFKRACPEGYSEAVNLMKATNSNQSAVKRNKIMRVLSEGGSPLKTFMENLDG